MQNRYSLVASNDDVTSQIKRLGSEILNAYPHESPLFVALLKGAAPFASQLMFEITKSRPDYHPQMDYMMVATYGHGKTAGRPEIITDIDPRTSVRGRSIIILDDVLDKGITADFVKSHLLERGAERVELAVLVDKQTHRLKDISASYTGMRAKDEWLVGMGMDDADLALEGMRWAQEIHQINR